MCKIGQARFKAGTNGQVHGHRGLRAGFSLAGVAWWLSLVWHGQAYLLGQVLRPGHAQAASAALSFDSCCGYPGEGPQSKDRKLRGPLRVGTANVTTCGSFWAEFQEDHSNMRECHVWALQEHKLACEDDWADAQTKLGRMGWKGHFQAAGTGPSGGPSGGVGWVWQEWLSVGDVGMFLAEGRITTITLGTPTLGCIALGSIYGWTGDHPRT